MGCNLDKDLSKREKNNQLVKCKDTGFYLQLYKLKMKQTLTHVQVITNIRQTLVEYVLLSQYYIKQRKI